MPECGITQSQNRGRRGEGKGREESRGENMCLPQDPVTHSPRLGRGQRAGVAGPGAGPVAEVAGPARAGSGAAGQAQQVAVDVSEGVSAGASVVGAGGDDAAAAAAVAAAAAATGVAVGAAAGADAAAAEGRCGPVAGRRVAVRAAGGAGATQAVVAEAGGAQGLPWLGRRAGHWHPHGRAGHGPAAAPHSWLVPTGTARSGKQDGDTQAWPSC